jgi:hypothetical protein
MSEIAKKLKPWLDFSLWQLLKWYFGQYGWCFHLHCRPTSKDTKNISHFTSRYHHLILVLSIVDPCGMYCGRDSGSACRQTIKDFFASGHISLTLLQNAFAIAPGYVNKDTRLNGPHPSVIGLLIGRKETRGCVLYFLSLLVSTISGGHSSLCHIQAVPRSIASWFW